MPLTELDRSVANGLLLLRRPLRCVALSRNGTQCRPHSAGTLYTHHLATQPHGSRASIYSSPCPRLAGQVADDEDLRDLGACAQRAGRELHGQRELACRVGLAGEIQRDPQIEELSAHAMVRALHAWVGERAIEWGRVQLMRL